MKKSNWNEKDNRAIQIAKEELIYRRQWLSNQARVGLIERWDTGKPKTIEKRKPGAINSKGVVIKK